GPHPAKQGPPWVTCGLLKARLAKLKRELIEPKGGGGGGTGEGFDVAKTGDAPVGFVGFPVGRQIDAVEQPGGWPAYEFTTLTTVPGVIKYKGAQDPAASTCRHHRGRRHKVGGNSDLRWARTCSLILIVLDVLKPLQHKRLIEHEPPNIGFKREGQAGASTCSCLVPQSELDGDVVKGILNEYKIHNADITLSRGPDRRGSRATDVYIPAIYIDQITIEELDVIYKDSPTAGNFDDLLELIWDYLHLVRASTPSPRASCRTMRRPSCLKDRDGRPLRRLLQQAAPAASSGEFKYALVWGSSVKHTPQKAMQASSEAITCAPAAAIIPLAVPATEFTTQMWEIKKLLSANSIELDRPLHYCCFTSELRYDTLLRIRTGDLHCRRAPAKSTSTLASTRTTIRLLVARATACRSAQRAAPPASAAGRGGVKRAAPAPAVRAAVGGDEPAESDEQQPPVKAVKVNLRHTPPCSGLRSPHRRLPADGSEATGCQLHDRNLHKLESKLHKPRNFHKLDTHKLDRKLHKLEPSQYQNFTSSIDTSQALIETSQARIFISSTLHKLKNVTHSTTSRFGSLVIDTDQTDEEEQFCFDFLEYYHVTCLVCSHCGRQVTRARPKCWLAVAAAGGGGQSQAAGLRAASLLLPRLAHRLSHCHGCGGMRITSDSWVHRLNSLPFHLSCLHLHCRQLSQGEECAMLEDKLLCKMHYLETVTGSSGGWT
uniref:C2 domain-containing protein n=1 Tax=Macrostomum lignano TaxID=282301 RepID=A0A1I8F724_9PLAT